LVEQRGCVRERGGPAFYVKEGGKKKEIGRTTAEGGKDSRT